MSLMLLASLCVLRCGHLNNQVPDVAVYRELPFLDAPEALEVWTLKDEYQILPPEVWAEMRPMMLMIPPETWTAIKKSWLKACILDRTGKCEQEANTVDNFVKETDKIVEKIMNLQK